MILRGYQKIALKLIAEKYGFILPSETCQVCGRVIFREYKNYGIGPCCANKIITEYVLDGLEKKKEIEISREQAKKLSTELK